MSEMTADEAITAIRECAYMTGMGAESAALTRDAEKATAAIREAFEKAETDDRARAELERLEKCADEAPLKTYGQILWRQVQGEKCQLLKRIIGEGS